MTNSQTPTVVRDCHLDWVKFDAHVARDGSLSPRAKALYAALATYADATHRSTDEDPQGPDIPSRSSLAACLGVSVDTIDRATKELEDYQFPSGAHLLKVERRKDPRNPKSNLPSVYRLLDPEHWDERAAARVERRETKGGRTDAARGGRTDAARGGRTDAARGGRTDAAVPIPPRGFKEHTQEDGDSTVDSAPTEVAEPERVCVPKEAKRALENVLSTAVPLEIRDRITKKQSDQLALRVQRCLDRGHSPEMLAKRTYRICNVETLRPYKFVYEALSALESEPPAASRTSGTPGASQASSVDSACVACGARVSVSAISGLVMCQGCAAAGYADLYATEVAA